jgi:hypothetical protein
MSNPRKIEPGQRVRVRLVSGRSVEAIVVECKAGPYGTGLLIEFGQERAIVSRRQIVEWL